MANHSPHKPHHPHGEPPGETEPGLHPIEPDQGPITPPIPEEDDGQTGIPEV